MSVTEAEEAGKEYYDTETRSERTERMKRKRSSADARRQEDEKNKKSRPTLAA